MNESNSSRRRFLASASAAALSQSALAALPAAQKLAFSPAAFEITHERALIWACGAAPAQLRVIWRTANEAAWRDGPLLDLTEANDTMHHVALTGLPAASVIVYRFIDAQSKATASEICSFKTAPHVSDGKFRFVFSADMDEAYQPFRIFDAMTAAKPDFALLLGDTIYADLPRKSFSTTTPHYRRKYAANRADPSLQSFLAQHGTYVTWDDHEVENNFNASHPAIALAQQVYRAYWPCESVTSDGLYRAFTWGGAHFTMLDTRTYRSPRGEADDAKKTMLGAAQKAWFKAQLKASRAAFHFVITAVPFQGGGQDTWGGYRTERREIEAFLRAEKIKGVVFLSGDYHLARDWSRPEAGYHEFMAGPIASFTHYAHNPSARERYDRAGTFHFGDGYNFAVVDVDCDARKMRIEWRDSAGKLLGEREI